MSVPYWGIIARANRWWMDPDEISRDEHVTRFEGSTVRWEPEIFSPEDVVDGVYTLRGPRQVGKTTMLKLFIRRLLASNFNPSSIVYVPCDIFKRHEQLLELIIAIRERISGRLIMILDEVTLIDEWQRAVKIFVDEGFLKNTTIIACGSHAVDVKKGATYLVGRRGQARYPIDRIMLTMSFREYVATLEPRLVRNIRSISDIISMNPFEREALIEKTYHLFMRYLRTGGFPRVIDEYNKSGTISKTTISDFINYIMLDITRLGKSESIARSLLHTIIKQKCNPTSWNSIAREIGVSQPTAQEYGELLSKMYLVRPVYHPNRTFTRQDEKKNKKLILREPFFYHLGTIWGYGFPEIDINTEEIIMQNIEREQQHIVEMVIIEYLSRTHIVYYWRAQKELDAIVLRGRKVRGVEVKWKEHISRSEIRDAIRTYNKLPLSREKMIIATKREYQEQESVILIPAPLLLLVEKQII